MCCADIRRTPFGVSTSFREHEAVGVRPVGGADEDEEAASSALHLNPGAQDGETFPASGDCQINDDGSIGTPYPMSASVTWQITWAGSDGTGGGLPDGIFEITQDMNVQEIQSVNH
jgi:hypothetical protein